MGISYYKCDWCGECLPDCSVTVKECVNGHGLCENCLNEVINLSKIKYFVSSEPALENSDEYIYAEFCPICKGEKK